MKLYQYFKKISLITLLFFMSSMVVGQNNLIISQYVETSSGTTPKGIELLNVSGATIDFSVTELDIKKGGNGGSAASVFSLSLGTLVAGEVMVIGTSDIETYLTNEGLTILYETKSFSFNGDDALEIHLGGAIEDMFGTTGSDPGSDWSGGGVSTRNSNIQLLSGITSGDVDGWTDPSTRFETITTDNSLTGFGLAPTSSCTAPSTQATAGVPTVDGDNQITMNWVRGNGTAGVVVIAKEGSAVDADPQSGTTYTANAAFGSGDEIGTGNFVVYAGTGISVATTSLGAGTTYHFAVFEYNTTDVCYATPGVTASETTTTSLDTDSDIVVPTTQVAAGFVSSTANDILAATDVFSFKLTDGGTTDGVATSVKTIVIEKAANNTVGDWSAIIAGAILNDGADITVTSTTVNADNITFDLTGNEYQIADNTSKEITLSIWLATSVVDQEVLAFEIPAAHNFEAENTGSTFATVLSGAVTSNTQTIEVDATVFDITSESFILTNHDFTVMANAVDVNGNLDTEARTISLSLTSGGGNLTSTTGLTAQTMISGTFTWSDVQHNTVENIELTIDDDGSSLTASSGIIAVLGDLFFQDYFEYADASFLNSSAKWNHSSGSTDQMLITAPGLSYADYPNSGVGNAALIVEGDSEDLVADIVSISSGSVFVSALVNVSGTNKPDSNGEYFLHGRQGSGSFATRVYVKDDGGILRFGITKVSGSVEYLPADYNYDETYLLVFKYTFNSGAADDDVMDFWVNPVIDGSEPSPTHTHSATQTDILSFAQIGLRQSGGTGDVKVDGIRASVTWADLLPTACSAPTTQASAVTFGTTGDNSMVINWVAGNGNKSVVIMKEASAVDAVPLNGEDYSSATSVFSDGMVEIGNGNFVVYANDNTTQTVAVTGLSLGTTYHVAIFDYNDAGFCYNNLSSAIGENSTTSPVVLTVVESITDFGSVDNGANSASQSYTAEGTNLVDDITITAPANFEVSLDDISFSSSLNLTHAGGVVATTTIYTRFSPLSGANEVITGDISIVTPGATDITIAVTGTESGNAVPVVENFDICDDFQTWEFVSITGDQIWGCTSFGNNDTNGIQMSGFSGGPLDNEDWLISRSFDFTATSGLSFWSRTAFAGLSMDVKVSEDYNGGGDPSTATWTDLVVTLPAITSDVWTETTGVNLSAFVGSGKYIAFVYYSNPSDGAARWTLDDISVGNASYTVPLGNLAVTASISDFGSVDNGSISASQSFSVEGTDLVADVLVNAPANFEVSLDDATFSASVNLTPASGTLSSTSVFVRFIPTSGANGTLNGNIVVSSTDAISQKIAVTGTESGNAAIGPDLFFSEYIEGTGNNKAIEIYNGTGAAVDLSNYTIKQSHSGIGFDNDPVADVYNIVLSGTLADGDVYVIYNGEANNSAIIAEGDLSLTYANTGEGVRVAAFNGDDALGLFKNGLLIDIIGDQNNAASGGAWDVAGVTGATASHILIRKQAITTGNVTPLGSFGTNSTDSEWEVIVTDVEETTNVTTIGNHDAATPVDPGFTLNTTGFEGDFADTAVGAVSDASSYTVAGTEITGDFTITIPVGFEASLTSDFSNKVGDSELPLSITPDGGIIDNVTVYVRFKPNAATSFSGNLVNSATGYPDVSLALTGTGTEDPTLGVEDFLAHNISVYPNPVSKVLSINIPNSFGAGNVKLVNLEGAVIKTGNIGAVNEFDVSDLRAGIYLLQITNKQTVISHRVIVK